MTRTIMIYLDNAATMPDHMPQAPSAILHLGNRTIVVEATPLPKSRLTRLGVVVAQPRDNVLRLRSRRAFIVACLGAMLVVLVTITALFAFLWLNGARLDLSALCAFYASGAAACMVAGALGLILLRRPRAEFSRDTKRFRSVAADRRPGEGVQVLAIELVRGREDEDVNENSGPVQINLLLDDSELPRVGFVTFRGAAWAREAGRRLAGCLDVPLVDQLTEEVERWHAADGSHSTEAIG